MMEKTYKGKKGYNDLIKEHYSNTKLILPDKLPRREIAFSFDEGFDRYQYFESEGELREAIISKSNPPHGVYASTAKYLDPHDCKDLIEVNLIFDLDKSTENFEDRFEHLDYVRNLTKRLIDHFLFDLGIQKEEIKIEFSGNKGFHLRIEGNKYTDLGVIERRQILDYVQAKNLSKPLIYRDEKLNYHGWGRIGVYFIEELLKDTSVENMRKYFSKNQAKKVSTALQDPETIEELKAGRLGVLKSVNLTGACMKFHKNLTDIIDRKPTVDKRRILRVTGSLHGKSGLVSTELEYEDLEMTEMIIDKIIERAGTDLVTVELDNDTEIDFPFVNTIKKGTHKVPRYQALYILAKK